MQQETAVAVVFSLIVLGGVVVIVAGMRNRARILEMAHRERLAMIERGLTPPGDLGGAYFERPAARSSRMLSLGIVIVGLGLGLALLIGVRVARAGDRGRRRRPVVVLGAAFIVTALVVHAPPKPDDRYLRLRPIELERSTPPVATGPSRSAGILVILPPAGSPFARWPVSGPARAETIRRPARSNCSETRLHRT